MAATGNKACIKLPQGAKLGGISKVSGLSGQKETDFYVPAVHCAMNLLHNHLVSWVRRAPICTQCESYRNGAFYVFLEASDGSKINKAVILLKRNGVDKAEKWEVSPEGARKL